jgi:hypothetical protein
VDVVNAARWVGVLIAIVGAVIVAPAGAQRWAEDTAKRTRATSARLIRWARRSQTVHPGRIASGATGSTATVTITAAAGSVSAESGDLADKVEALRQRVDELHSMVNKLRADHDKRLDEVSAELHAATAELRDAVDAVRRRQDEAERSAAQIDAHGLPVIVWGIVLTGIPDGPLRWWLWGWFGWLLIVAGAAWTALATRRAFLRRL